MSHGFLSQPRRSRDLRGSGLLLAFLLLVLSPYSVTKVPGGGWVGEARKAEETISGLIHPGLCFLPDPDPFALWQFLEERQGHHGSQIVQ